MASFAVSVVSAALLVVLAAGKYTPGEDDAGYGFLVFLLVLATLLCQIVALELGVAGGLQRERGGRTRSSASHAVSSQWRRSSA